MQTCLEELEIKRQDKEEKEIVDFSTDRIRYKEDSYEICRRFDTFCSTKKLINGEHFLAALINHFYRQIEEGKTHYPISFEKGFDPFYWNGGFDFTSLYYFPEWVEHFYKKPGLDDDLLCGTLFGDFDLYRFSKLALSLNKLSNIDITPFIKAVVENIHSDYLNSKLSPKDYPSHILGALLGRTFYFIIARDLWKFLDDSDKNTIRNYMLLPFEEGFMKKFYACFKNSNDWGKKYASARGIHDYKIYTPDEIEEAYYKYMDRYALLLVEYSKIDDGINILELQKLLDTYYHSDCALYELAKLHPEKVNLDEICNLFDIHNQPELVDKLLKYLKQNKNEDETQAKTLQATNLDISQNLAQDTLKITEEKTILEEQIELYFYYNILKELNEFSELEIQIIIAKLTTEKLNSELANVFNITEEQIELILTKARKVFEILLSKKTKGKVLEINY